MKVAFLSEYVAEDGAPFTGSHLQSHLLAKLVSERWESILIAFSHRGRREEYSENDLRVLLLPPSRWEIVRAYRMLRTVLRERPDVLYVRGRSYHLVVGAIASLFLKTSLVWGVNAQEGARDFKYLRTLVRSRRSPLRKVLLFAPFFVLDLGVAVGMRLANVITVQNEVQMSEVKRRFPNKRVALLPNLQPPPRIPNWEPDIPKPYFVWAAARPTPTKRPRLFLEIARKLPDLRFVMVGYHPDSLPSNLTVFPRLTRDRLHALLYHSRALIITSSPGSEGVPNVAIEAMLMGVPVVSVGDDFGLLNDGGGIVVKDVEGAVDVLRRLAYDEGLHARLSKEAKGLAHERFVEGAREAWIKFWDSLLR